MGCNLLRHESLSLYNHFNTHEEYDIQSLSVYIYLQMSLCIVEYVKIHHRSGTLNKHSSLAIFDKHLVRRTNQGLPKIPA